MELKIHSIRNFSILLILSTFFSSFTLWLLDASWIKYLLFIIEISIITTSYFVLNNYYFDILKNNKLHLFLDRYLVSKGGLLLDLLLIVSSGILLIIPILHLGEFSSPYYLVLAFLSISFLSGFAIINLFNLNRYISKLESFILSYISSFIFSSFITLALIFINENERSFIIALTFLSIGIISFIQHIKRNTSKDFKSEYSITNSFCNNIDIFAIVISIIFYIVVFCFLYPSFALLPGSDIARHYNYSLILSRSPDLYTAFNYILFHSFEVSLQNLTGFNQPVIPFQTILVLLNIFIPLTVYALAKRYLEDIDKRIPALSIIFYTFLSNFSFLFFTKLKVLDFNGNTLDILRATAENTLNGTINFIQPFPWFTPMSVSFVLFTISFLLLRLKNIPRAKFIILFGSLVLAMYLIHVTEAVTLVIILSLYFLIFERNNNNKRIIIKDALIASLLSLIVSSAFFYYISFNWSNQLLHETFNFGLFISLILSLVLTSFSLIWNKYRKKILPRFKSVVTLNFLKFFPHISNKNFYKYLSFIILFFYLISFLTWIGNNLKASSFDALGISPWFVYPLTLGIAGILAILGIRYFGEVASRMNYITLPLFSILFLFIVGRLVSYVNLNIMFTEYWEKRFISYIFLFICILAPISLIKFRDWIEVKINTSNRTERTSYNVLLISTISIIILSGFSSMTLQTNFWFTFTSTNQSKINDKEMEALSYLKKILQNDPRAFVISPSDYSNQLLDFASPVYRLSLPKSFFFATYPDFSLFSLAFHNLDHAYIYIQNSRDFSILKNTQQSWFLNHLLPRLPIVYSNAEVSIYNVTKVSFPLADSNNIMIEPIERFDNSWLFVQDMLSRSGINYTTRFELDPHIFKSKNIILGSDLIDSNNFSIENISNNNDNKFMVISGNWTSSIKGLQNTGIKNITSNIDSLNNIILSPVYSKNRAVNISTSFKIHNLDQNISNYVYIIYSWINPDNYRYAGINILKNNVYFYIANVVNGKTYFNPLWPGMKTDIKFRPNMIYNLTLYLKNGNMQELHLNNTRILTQNDTNELGYIGLGYQRIKNILFDRFDIQGIDKVENSHILPRYLSFVKSGGNLIVFNYNGYGDIFNSIFKNNTSSNFNRHAPYTMFNGPFYKLGNNESETQDSDPYTMFNGPFYKLGNNESETQDSDPYTMFNGPFYKLGNNIEIVQLHNKHTKPVYEVNTNGMDRISMFKIKSTLDIPLPNNSISVYKRSFGSGNIIYIDIFPIIKILDKISTNLYYKDLGKISSKIINLDQIDQNYLLKKNIFNDMVALFGNIVGSGDIQINTSSLIFPDNFKSMDVAIIKNGHKNVILNDISRLELNGYTNVLLNGISDYISLKNGKGFYIDAYLAKNASNKHSVLNIDFPETRKISNIVVSGIASDKSFKIENISGIHIINNKPLHLYVRQPQLNIFGNITISELHANTISSKMGYTPGKDYSFFGRMSLSIYLSDAYNFANKFSIYKSSILLHPKSY